MRSIFIVMFVAAVLAVSCKKAAAPKNETEHTAINGVELIFRQGATVMETAVAEDPDGDGGNPPTRIDPIDLKAGQTYAAAVFIKNISNGVVKDVTAEIQLQGKEHEFYYIPTGVNLTVTKTDKDVNGFPLGIQSSWITNTAGSGSILVKLMHKPLIKGPNDDPSKGHTDVQISFPVRIQ